MKNLTELKEIQKIIQSAIQNNLELSQALELLLVKPPLSSTQRMMIYQDAYLMRLKESLTDDFERVQSQLNSPAQFEKIIHSFIIQCPSTVRNIAEYSEDFPFFLKDHYPDLFESALCDWYSLVAIKMPDVKKDSILSFKEIQNGLSFRIRAFCSTIPFETPDQNYITLKKDGEIQIHKISVKEYELIRYLSQSQTMDNFIEQAQRLKIEDEDIAKKINEWITQFVIYCERV